MYGRKSSSSTIFDSRSRQSTRPT